MSEQLAVPLKTATEVNFEECLKPFFQKKKSWFFKPKTSKAEEEIENAVKDLDKLRKDVVSKKAPKSIYSLEQLYRYHDQLAILEEKFPSETGVTFTWEDAFSKASVFSGKPSLSLSFLGYEKLCVMFNIAALQTQLAVEGTIVDTDEERKNSMKYYQSAAGIFERLQPSEQAGDNLTPDFHPDLLTGVSALMLAQAQEIFVTKAMKDRMKDANLAKLCAQTEELYSEALLKMTRDKCKYTLDRSWVQNVKAKKFAYTGLANFFQSKVCDDQKKVGEQIARLNVAIENLKSAQDKIGNSSYLSFYMNEAKRLHASATKDNDFIYHEVVPAASHLPTIPKVASARLAKITPCPEKFATGFTNPFASLIEGSKEADEAVHEKETAQIGWNVDPSKSPLPPPRKKKEDGKGDGTDSPSPVNEPPMTKTNVKAPTWNQVMNDSWSLLKPYFDEIVYGKK